MRKRDASMTRVMLLVVVTIGTVCVFNSIWNSASYVAQWRRPCQEVTTVTTQVRLIESAALPSPVQRLRQAEFVPSKTLHCTEAQAPVDLERLNRTDVVQRALRHRAKIAGFHNKSGILAPLQWRPEFMPKRNAEMSVWFSYPHKKHTGCGKTQPPVQFPGCVVNINHHYKFIWIKGKRVGSTVIREPLGWICADDWKVPEGADKTYCSEELHADEEVSLEDVRQYWDEYFVFSFVRNPYARFASGYTFVRSLMGECPHLTDFGKLCDSPFLLAKVCSTLSCCWTGAVTHHLHHAMEQNSCLFTESGEPAVDFIGEMESLSSDLQIVLDEINRRRAPHLPELRMKEPVLAKINSQGEQYVSDLFMTNTTCLHRIELNYWADFERLGYDRITESVQTALSDTHSSLQKL